ncbi:hypothetical protein A3197_18045 [Candidatus Thiodiazotropha endoloripes]|nr:hypothetical protein A3197_18045 [Candidatus Thiodiazotropha endoloripes]
MNDFESIEKERESAWRKTALIVLILSISFFLFVQGSHIDIGNTIITETSVYAASIYAQIVLIPLYVFFYSYTSQLILLNADRPVLKRLPALIELHLPEDNRFGQNIKKLSLILVFLIPLYSLGHCYLKSLDGTVFVYEPCSTSQTGSAKCFVGFSSGWKESLTRFSQFTEIFTDGNKYRYDKQITYFPGWQPWLMTLFILGVFWVWIRALINLWLVRKQKSRG